MLSVKIAYDSKSQIPELLRVASFNPIFEAFNEDNMKEIKKAWKLKGAAAARQVPFIGVFEDNNLIKAFYAEDNSATDKNFFEWFEQYLKEHGKKGYMKIVKVEGDETRYKLGTPHEGNTQCFHEGTALYLTNGDRWFHTSVIKSIDWEAKTFKTMNSTYSFELINGSTNTGNND